MAKQRPIVDEETGEILATPRSWSPVPLDSPFWKTPYNHDTLAEANAGALICPEPTKTQQHLAAEADINNILAKFRETGVVWGTPGAPTYSDVMELNDLQDILQQGRDAQAAWEELPLAARNALQTPERMLAYIDHCMQSGDIDPLRELGIAKPKQKPPEPQTVDKAPSGGTPAPTAPKEAGAPAPASK